MGSKTEQVIEKVMVWIRYDQSGAGMYRKGNNKEENITVFQTESFALLQVITKEDFKTGFEASFYLFRLILTIVVQLKLFHRHSIVQEK